MADDDDDTDDEQGDDEGDEGDEDSNDPLALLNGIASEAETNHGRLKQSLESLDGEGTTSERLAALEHQVNWLGAEMAETVMSVVADLAGAAFDCDAFLRQYLHDEVEPYLQDDADGASADDGAVAESYLDEADAELFRGLLGEMLSGLDAVAGSLPPEIRVQNDAMTARIRAALGRLAVIAGEAADDDDATEPADDDDATTEPASAEAGE